MRDEAQGARSAETETYIGFLKYVVINSVKSGYYELPNGNKPVEKVLNRLFF